MRQPYQGGSLPGSRELVLMAEEDKRFKVRRAEGITALNYAYVSDEEDQFAFPRSEMRGLMIDEEREEVLARPFQKFWNIQEAGARETDWSEEHVVLPKLDGSLIFPAGRRWVTRGGVTDTSRRAEELVATIGGPLAALLEKTRTDPRDGAACTPCFEYIGPDNQIVLRYPRSQLVLLAVRRIADGAYWSTEQVRKAWQDTFIETGLHRDLRMAEPLFRTAEGEAGGPAYAKDLAAEVAGWSGASKEGVVVAFEGSGHRVKIKCREYVALHRARDDYSSETRVLTVWSDGNQEQLLERLSNDRSARLASYYLALEKRIDERATSISTEASRVWYAAEGDRKAAAAEWIRRTADRERTRPLGFNVFDALAQKAEPIGAVDKNLRRLIARACGRQSLIDEKVAPALGDDPPRWRPPDGNERDASE